MEVFNKILSFIIRNIKKVIMTAVITVVVAMCALMAYDYAFRFVTGDSASTYDEDGESVMLTIAYGSTSSEIAQQLYENGLIDSVWSFRLHAKLEGAENDFQYGTYTFIVGMSDQDIIELLVEGNLADSVTITIPEGWTIEQIASYLEEEEICLAEDFIEASNDVSYDFDYYANDMLTGESERRNLLEGYLFPETYEVIPADGAEAIVKRMLRQFEIEFTDEDLAQMDALGVTMDEVVTMASVIEREISDDDERAYCAAVLYNRMEQGMAWQLNSTVLYALGEENSGEDNLTNDDLTVESGYNTYLYDGYPTGPICNPGYASIQAALYPEDTDALYFIIDPDGDGTTHLFTDDYDEFLAAKEALEG